MATETEVTKLIGQLVALNLRPMPQDTKATIAAYTLMLADIPGDALAQAAREHATNSAFFPSVAELRAAAQTVKVQAQREDEVRRSQDTVWYAGKWCSVQHDPGYSGVMVGWRNWQPGDVPRMPRELAEKIERLAARVGDGLLSEGQAKWVDDLMAEWLRGTA